MINNQLTAFRADGGDISQGRIKEIAENAYGDEEKRRLAQRVLVAGAELQCFGEFVKYEDLCSDE